ncbi:MAG: hypothetical protein QXE02_08000, partial [Sulfolobales archaeon]
RIESKHRGICEMSIAKQTLCPRCGRKAEFVIETYISDGMRRVTYLYRCTCRWRKEVETLLIKQENGKIIIMRASGNNK